MDQFEKTAGAVENPAHPQILICDIQINTLPSNICIKYSSHTTQNTRDHDRIV